MFKRNFPWHPYLFGLYPILLLYVANAHQVALDEIFYSILIVLAMVAIVTTSLNLVIKEIYKSSLIVTVGLIWFFSWGHILQLGAGTFLGNLNPLHPKYNINMTILACLSVGLASYYLLRSKISPRRLTHLANTIGFLLVAIQLCSTGWVLLNRQTAVDENQDITIAANSDKNLPDIYYILVDAYGRSDILKEIYNYDNQPFLNHLREKGFYIAEQSHSNYSQTLLSLTSSLNMNLLDQITTLDTSSNDRIMFKDLVDHNQVFRVLRANGYKIAAFEPSYNMLRFTQLDITLREWFQLSEFSGHLIETTPLPFFASNFANQYLSAKKRIDYIFEQLPILPKSESPRLVFAYILCPHPPFMFDSTGRFYEPPMSYTISDGSDWMGDDRTVEEYRDRYVQQAKYISNRLSDLIDNILKNNQNDPPIILLQSDHGPASELDWSSIENTNVNERMGIINAYYLPGIEDSTVLYPSITPANSFRVILNQYLDADLPLVPDQSYFSDWEHPFLFFNVTDQLNTQNSEHATPK